MAQNKINELAAEMEAILNDDTYRSVFERPRIKMASVETDSESKKNPVEVIYKQLVEASEILDDLGLVKSAELALSAVESLVSEATKEEEEEEEETQEVKPDEDKPADGKSEAKPLT